MAETKATKAATEKTVPVNPWQDMIPVFCARGGDNEPNFVYAVVNGRAFQIPRGKQQLVPRPVYEILSRSEHAKNITAMYDDVNRNAQM